MLCLRHPGRVCLLQHSRSAIIDPSQQSALQECIVQADTSLSSSVEHQHLCLHWVVSYQHLNQWGLLFCAVLHYDPTQYVLDLLPAELW